MNIKIIAITVICQDTGHQFTALVDKDLYRIVTETDPKSDENWDAYLSIYHRMKDTLYDIGVTFWEAKSEEYYWSSEL